MPTATGIVIGLGYLGTTLGLTGPVDLMLDEIPCILVSIVPVTYFISELHICELRSAISPQNRQKQPPPLHQQQ